MPPGRTLLTQIQIRTRVKELGRALTRHYRGQRPVFLGVMNGALFFLADLVRVVEIDDIEISCLRLASYAGTKSTGHLRGLNELNSLRTTLKGRPVLIVDDILDTGRTLSALVVHLKKLGVTEVKTCVLLDKRRQREVAFQADWIGFRIADEFIVGYGLDCDGRYRTLKQVRVLES